MSKPVMSAERSRELRAYFAPQELPCGCVYLGSERAAVCEAHDLLGKVNVIEPANDDDEDVKGPW